MASSSLLDTLPTLTPHGFCLAWDPRLMLLQVGSDALIALSYYSIPVVLVSLVLRRRDLAFGWIVALFAVFILACGTTHVMEIVTLWSPDYLVQGVIKAMTAVASVLTAILLWPLLPRVLALPSPSMLRRANDQLAEQVREKEALLLSLQQETAERQRTQMMLAQSQRMEAIGQLTGGIAHDFNNLLMVIQGNLEILQGRIGGDVALDRYIDRSLRSVRQGSTLTQQLLAFARRQALQPAAVDVNTQVRQIIGMMPQSDQRELDVELRLADGLWAAEADPQQLENAVLNLVINARDAMPGGGKLVIETANVLVSTRDAERPGSVPPDIAPGAYVSVSVRDSGIGMADEVRQMAFEPFFTTKPVGSGSGLGLSQVYGFAKQSRGHATLQSTVGHGTTVTLHLRRWQPDQGADASARA